MFLNCFWVYITIDKNVSITSTSSSFWYDFIKMAKYIKRCISVTKKRCFLVILLYFKCYFFTFELIYLTAQNTYSDLTSQSSSSYYTQIKSKYYFTKGSVFFINYVVYPYTSDSRSMAGIVKVLQKL